MFYCDIHTHILPGVDDGARNMEEAMEMLDIAYQDGARSIFLTPHYIPGRNTYKKENLIETTETLQGKAEKEFPGLKLFLGNELYYVPGAPMKLRESDFCFMAGSRYALVEFATNASYEDIYRGIREFSDARIFPIIAHYERYSCLYKKEKYLQELRKLGAYFQMNGEAFMDAGKMTGIGRFFGSGRAGKSAWNIAAAKLGYLDFIGSDAHDNQYRKPGIGKACNMLLTSGVDRWTWTSSMLIEDKYI